MPSPRAASMVEALVAARFVPVIRAGSGEEAVFVGRALAEGGCRVLEVTLTTPDAAAAIRSLAGEGLTVGAGTVLSAADAETALDAGARFLVSPCLVPAVLQVGVRRDRLVIPGALTPGEAIAAHLAGAPIVKIFPVASMGGPRYLQLLRDPLPQLRFFPTGGVTLEDAPAYLRHGAVALGVGTALVAPRAVAARDAGVLTAEAQRWCAALQAEPRGATSSS